MTRERTYWLLSTLAMACFAVVLLLPPSCGGTSPSPSSSSAVELCASAMALSPEVREQAAKLQRSPIELAREACAAVLLAAQLAQANVPELGAQASGGAPTTASMAGAAGSP